MVERRRALRPRRKAIPEGMYWDAQNQMILPNDWIAVRGTSEATGRVPKKTPKSTSDNGK